MCSHADGHDFVVLVKDGQDGWLIESGMAAIYTYWNVPILSMIALQVISFPS